MNIGLFEQLASYSFSSTAFEEDVIGNDDRNATVLFQDGEYVLEKVELFVARARPEIVAMNDERLFLFVAGFIDDRDAAFLAERRIGQHHSVFAVFTSERVFHHHWHVRGIAADAVKHEIHAAE